ncbi:unnamed protein product [Diatraea saccharalis]|uniref:Uncharacterized protein n=1 Tax=Diatraea saccharalis TaxID=40085 RepID=A0A9N9RDG9_9NEOP|nr:unnamed protein product [Diatraea saccharalis]
MLTLTIAAKSLPHKTCNRLKINEQWYDREIIISNMGRPYSLQVHKSTNTLFFSYSEPDTYTDTDFQLFDINLATKEQHIIAGIRGGCAVAIDQANDDIYLGGSDGIYKYNMLTKLADYYKEKGKNIWSLYYNRNLFYVSYPEQKLHIEIDGKFMAVKEFGNFEVDLFHVTGNNEIYVFANRTGLYTYDSNTFTVHILSEFLSVRQITEDNEGTIYICTNIGIFTYIYKSRDLIQIVDLKNVYGLAFDKDNQFVFSDEKNVVLLKHSEYGCITNDNNW